MQNLINHGIQDNRQILSPELNLFTIYIESWTNHANEISEYKPVLYDRRTNWDLFHSAC